MAIIERPLERSIVADKLLDTKGLNCPLPILKAKKAIADVKGGGTLEVLATDPGSVPDFKAFCEAGGHTLLEQTVDAGVFRFLIRRAA
jgi:tRNA 2-thiouridine synthesizing protein A